MKKCVYLQSNQINWPLFLLPVCESQILKLQLHFMISFLILSSDRYVTFGLAGYFLLVEKKLLLFIARWSGQ